MSDYAHAEEVIRTARGPWTQQQDLAGIQGATLAAAANDTAISVAVSAGNTSVSVRLPAGPTPGQVCTVLWKNNGSRMASVTSAVADGGLTVRQEPVVAGTRWKFMFSGGAWRNIGP